MIPFGVYLFTMVLETSGPFWADQLEIEEQKDLCRAVSPSVAPGLAAASPRSQVEMESWAPPLPPLPLPSLIGTCVGRGAQHSGHITV